MTLSQDQFIKRAAKTHGNKYDYSQSKYKGMFEKVKIICSVNNHGTFEQEAHSHLRGNGCQKCNKERNIKRLTANKLSLEQFLKRAMIIHGNKYDYSKVKYVKYDSPIKILCREKGHGQFIQTPHNHLSGKGCKKCGYEKVSKSLSFSKEQFLKIANKKFNFEYDYSIIEYKNTSSIIDIICKTHGKFSRPSYFHLKGYGCPKCNCKKLNKMTIDMMIHKANIKHNNKYDYSKVLNIKNNRSTIDIICPKHGVFHQKIISHLNGHGCLKCGLSISRPEQQWLNSQNIPDDKLHRHLTIKINKKNYLVDGYTPETKTIYEFYGDFWHGNPKKFNGNDINCLTKTKFKDLYNKTTKREKEIINGGYNLIAIWESDFKKQLK